MPLEAFDHIFPEIARAEARIFEVSGPGPGVPLGTYLLREYYCNELGCDCRRVVVPLVVFHKETERYEVAASINYGWERPLYYKKWSRDPELWREMSGATLEPFAEQGPHAPQFLKVFQHLIRDHKLVAVFRRHYRLVKDHLK